MNKLVSRQYDPFQDFFNNLNSFIGDYSYAANTSQKYPAFDLYYTKNEDGDQITHIDLAVAGFTEEDIDITVDDDILRISGKKLEQTNEEEKSFQYKGLARRSFMRTFQLGRFYEVTGAELKDGILSIQIRKIVPEELKPKKIPLISK